MEGKGREEEGGKQGRGGVRPHKYFRLELPLNADELYQMM